MTQCQLFWLILFSVYLNHESRNHHIVHQIWMIQTSKIKYSSDFLSFVKNVCLLLQLHSPFSPPVKNYSHIAENQQARVNPWREMEIERQEKENIFGAMCFRSKTWQSHDQRHLIILELHGSFNPSQRTVFYWWYGGWGIQQCWGVKQCKKSTN